MPPASFKMPALVLCFEHERLANPCHKQKAQRELAIYTWK